MSAAGTNPSRAIHPTIFLVAWLVVGFVLQRRWPVDLPGADVLQLLQLPLLAVGVGLFVWSALELRRHDTTTDHGRATTRLVTGGPYAFSRNPIYVALVLILLGFSVDSGSLWFLLATLMFWGAVHRLTVLREETYLAGEFGEEYARYTESVRRWV